MEVHHKLPVDGIQRLASGAEGDAMPDGERTGLQQRVFHAGDPGLHGMQRGKDRRAPYALGAKVPNFLGLQQVEEGKGIARCNQAGLLPSA